MFRYFGRIVRVRDVVMLIAATSGAVLAAAGCSSSGGGTTAPQTGSLTVTITASAGATPSVTVRGPGGDHQTLSATQTLTGLAVGSYTITAPRTVSTAPIVATVVTATVSGSPANVTAGGTANASATSAQAPGTGGLWATNFTLGKPTDHRLP